MRRALLVIATVVVVGSAAFLGWGQSAGDETLAVIATSPTRPTVESLTPEATPSAEPSPTPVPTPEPTPTVPAMGASSCDIASVDRPSGTTKVIVGTGATAGSGSERTFTVEVEVGLGIDGDCFAREIERVLFDERSWVGTGEVTWRRVDTDPDTRIILASPATTDLLCLPFRTNGIFSCTIEQSRTVLNVNRWRNGAADFLGIEEYRIYLINHEIGHALKHNHVGCPGAGLVAPVMMQQTKSTNGCLANAWPLNDMTEG